MAGKKPTKKETAETPKAKKPARSSLPKRELKKQPKKPTFLKYADTKDKTGRRGNPVPEGLRVKNPLTPKDIEHFRGLLLEKWSQIVGDVNCMENGSLRKSRLDAAGDLSSMPIHMADVGTDNFEQEFALGLMDSERKLLTEIKDALKRIDEGTYGLCEGTGKSISRARLEASPWARYCIEYASMLEKGLVEEGQQDFRSQSTTRHEAESTDDSEDTGDLQDIDDDFEAEDQPAGGIEFEDDQEDEEADDNPVFYSFDDDKEEEGKFDKLE